MRMFWARHRFLMRLIIMSLTVVCIAVLLFNVAVFRRAHQYMEQQNREKYQSGAYAFAQYMEEQILLMYSRAVRFNYDQNFQNLDLEAHVFNQLEFIRLLRTYLNAAPLANEMCMYFEDSDFVISSTAKYDFSYFTMQYLADGNAALSEEIADFVTGDSAEQWSYFSTFGQVANSKQRLLVRISVTVPGTSGVRKANVLYCITADSLRSLFLSSMNVGMEYAILDVQGDMLYQSALLTDHLPSWLNAMENPTESLDYTVNKEKFTAFFVRNELTYLTVVPTEWIVRDLNNYYSAMVRMIWMCVAVLLIAAAFSVYVSYEPVHSMVRRTVKEPDEQLATDELGAIENEMERIQQQNERMNSLVLEQGDMLDDAIVDSLLRGKTVSAKQMEWIAQRMPGERFTVVAVFGLQLNHAARELLQEKLNAFADMRVMIVGMPQEQHTALMCALNGDASRQKFAQRLLPLLGGAQLSVGIGPEVEQLADVHAAYVCAMTAMHQRGGLTYYEEIVDENSQILEYPVTEALLLARSIEDGDENGVEQALKDLRAYLSQREHPTVQASFVRHELESAFIKHLRRLELPLSDGQMNELIATRDGEALCDMLADLAKSACREINARREQETRNFNQRILDYVNAHYTDKEISLIQVSDAFGLSIYALSRLYKEIAGIGFREHIIAKRMELAYHMVVSTEKSIREIADETGIGNPDYLTKLFKAHYGTTPSRLRAR